MTSTGAVGKEDFCCFLVELIVFFSRVFFFLLYTATDGYAAA